VQLFARSDFITLRRATARLLFCELKLNEVQTIIAHVDGLPRIYLQW